MTPSLQLDLFAPPPKDPAAERRHLWKLCWDWEGPQVGGRCQVDSVTARNETHGGIRFHYMAPCEIIAQDGDEYLCRIDYAPDCHCADIYNGQILRLGILEIWPPVRDFIIQRKAAA